VVEAPKGPPPAKPVYIYHAANQRVVEHQNDGSSTRKVLMEGSAQMGIPYQDPGTPVVQFR
jgi:hypothetical protein